MFGQTIWVHGSFLVAGACSNRHFANPPSVESDAAFCSPLKLGRPQDGLNLRKLLRQRRERSVENLLARAFIRKSDCFDQVRTREKSGIDVSLQIAPRAEPQLRTLPC